MKRQICILSVFILGFLSPSYSQNDWKPGFVIKSPGDTLFGLVDNRDSRSNSSRCFFRLSDLSETQIFTPDVIFGYGFKGDKYFVSKKSNDSLTAIPVFMQFLLHGKVNLYHMQGSESRFFIEKDRKMYELKNTKKNTRIDDVQYLLDSKEYIRLLTALLQEAEIKQEIENTAFEAQPLIKLAKKYHDKVCTDEKCVIYEKPKEKMAVKFGMHGSLQYCRLNFSSDLKSDFQTGTGLGCRLRLENVFEWEENISLNLDFSLHKFRYFNLTNAVDKVVYVYYNKKQYEISDNEYPKAVKNLEVDLDLVTLNLPLTLDYSFSKGRFRPNIGMGLLARIVLKQNPEFKYSLFYEEFGASVPKYHCGFQGRAGARYLLENNRTLYFDITCEYSQNMDMNFRLRNYQFSFLVGYSF